MSPGPSRVRAHVRDAPWLERAVPISKPPRLWLGWSVILIQSLIRGLLAALRVNRPADAKRRRLTSRKMSVSRAIVTSRSRFVSSLV